MSILRLLSEEVFDYSADQMTSTKTKNLKTVMCSEFSAIFQLCSEVLNTANQASLIKATLETLLRFFNWIPLGYIFETPIIETLRSRFLETPEFRNITLKCLTEIGSLSNADMSAYSEKLVLMFTEVLQTISKFIPLSLDLKTTYSSSNSRDQEFIQNMALFLCNFFSQHLAVSDERSNLSFITDVFSSSRTCQTVISLHMLTSISFESRKSMTVKFSRSVSSIGPRLFKACTMKCSNYQSTMSLPLFPWVSAMVVP